MSVQIGMPWHDGELCMHNKMGGLDADNPTHGALSQQGAFMLQQAPLLALGTLDDYGRPWTTVWGGEPGFARPLGGSMIGIKTPVDDGCDPVVEILCHSDKSQPSQSNPQQMAGKLMGGLTIDLDRRKRVKLAGKMVAGAVAIPEADQDDAQAQMQLVTHIQQSLGNCPKYINRKDIKPAPVKGKVISESAKLPAEAISVIMGSDLFFVSTTQANKDMDTNHRGGPAGFVRATKDEIGASVIVWPEYSGNRLYQTLGNLEVTPLAGLVFPDFDTGDVLYVTGRTDTLVGKEANALIPRSNLAVKLTVTGARLVSQGLPFRGTAIEASPYNPRIRPLAEEAHLAFDKESHPENSVKLLEQTSITPTISRFRFSMNNPASFKAGQWVALDFSDELDTGYSHMRDDDPTSINDDFVRTFTVSSPPPPRDSLADDHFEITVRRVGNVTRFMFYQQARHGLEIPMRGFGGDFNIRQSGDGIVPFIAGGVGITPVLAFLPSLDVDRFKLFWTLNIDDINLAIDIIKRHPSLYQAIELFLTGIGDEQAASEAATPLTDAGVKMQFRRLMYSDLNRSNLGHVWHVCVGTSLRKTLLEWLAGQEVIYEDFNF